MSWVNCYVVAKRKAPLLENQAGLFDWFEKQVRLFLLGDGTIGIDIVEEGVNKVLVVSSQGLDIDVLVLDGLLPSTLVIKNLAFGILANTIDHEIVNNVKRFVIANARKVFLGGYSDSHTVDSGELGDGGAIGPLGVAILQRLALYEAAILIVVLDGEGEGLFDGISGSTINLDAVEDICRCQLGGCGSYGVIVINATGRKSKATGEDGCHHPEQIETLFRNFNLSLEEQKGKGL